VNGMALCAGVGGLELGLHLALGDSYRTICYVERETHAAAILVARMAEGILGPAPVWDDLLTFDGRPWRGVVDIVSAGYPCQPFSFAGKRDGTADERHLWPNVLAIIEQCRPALVFLENVPGHLSLGFDVVCRDLQEMDYRVAACVSSAAEVGAPHRRERLFVLAHRNGQERRERDGESGCKSAAIVGAMAEPAHEQMGASGLTRQGSPMGDSDGGGYGKEGDSERPSVWADWAGIRVFPPGPQDAQRWREIPERLWPATTQPGVRRVADGSAARVDRLRACGNGVVPLVAAHAFRILAAELVTARKPGVTGE
jgi:DNA (cytosine-5)-methyltransferase 1